jgi:hypothetical protein
VARPYDIKSADNAASTSPWPPQRRGLPPIEQNRAAESVMVFKYW